MRSQPWFTQNQCLMLTLTLSFDHSFFLPLLVFAAFFLSPKLVNAIFYFDDNMSLLSRIWEILKVFKKLWKSIMGSAAFAANHRGQQLTPFLTTWQVFSSFWVFLKIKITKRKVFAEINSGCFWPWTSVDSSHQFGTYETKAVLKRRQPCFTAKTFYLNTLVEGSGSFSREGQDCTSWLLRINFVGQK